MSCTYSIRQAQANFPAVVREAEGHAVAITRRDKVVGYLVSPERMEAMLETMEILGNPEAMAALRAAKDATARYRPLESLDEAGQG